MAALSLENKPVCLLSVKLRAMDSYVIRPVDKLVERVFFHNNFLKFQEPPTVSFTSSKQFSLKLFLNHALVLTLKRERNLILLIRCQRLIMFTFKRLRCYEVCNKN